MLPVVAFGGFYWLRQHNVRSQTDAIVAPRFDAMASGKDLEVVTELGGDELQAEDFKAKYKSVHDKFGEFKSRDMHRTLAFEGGNWEADGITAGTFSSQCKFTKQDGRVLVYARREGNDWLIDGYRIQSADSKTIDFGKVPALKN